MFSLLMCLPQVVNEAVQQQQQHLHKTSHCKHISGDNMFTVNIMNTNCALWLPSLKWCFRGNSTHCEGTGALHVAAQLLTAVVFTETFI